MNSKKRAWLVRIVALICVVLLFGSVLVSLIVR